MFLSDFSIKRPVTITMIVIGIILFGMISLKKLSLDLLPELTYPTITIKTVYEGIAPEEIEDLLTTPIESAVAVVSNVVRVSSNSQESVSYVYVDFKWGTDMNIAVLDIREKIEQLYLPEEISKPIVLRYNPNFEPVMKLGINYNIDNSLNTETQKNISAELKSYVEDNIRQYIERIPGVAAVEINGGYEREVIVEPTPERLAQYNITIEEIADVIEKENVNLSGGEIYEGDLKYLVRTLNEFHSIDEIKNVIIKKDSEKSIFLKDIARVRDYYKDRKKIALLQGKECLTLSIYKQGDANTVDVCNNVINKLDFIKEQLTGKSELIVIYDQSEFIKLAINEVKAAALWGGLIAVSVIFLFFKKISVTLILTTSIPISIVATFLMLYFNKISLNMISLGGLALGIGMLVDDSIIVLENILRFREKGENDYDSAKIGASEIAGADAASTFTTIAVFFPLLFVSGISGQIFKDMGLAVTYSLLSSLVVSLTIIPLLCSITRKNTDIFKNKSIGVKNRFSGYIIKILYPVTFLFRYIILIIKSIIRTVIFIIKIIFITLLYLPEKIFDIHYGIIKRIYPVLLKYSLEYSNTLIIFSLIIFTAGFALVQKLDWQFIPELSQNEFFIDCKVPFGTPIENTAVLMTQISDKLNRIDGINNIICDVGSAKEPGTQIEREQSNYAKFLVTLPEKISKDKEMKKSILKKIHGIFMEIPGIQYKMKQPEYFTKTPPVEIEISGPDIKKIKKITNQLLTELKEIPYLENVNSNIKKGNPELRIIIDRDKCNFYNINVSRVAEILQNSILGEKSSEFKIGTQTGIKHQSSIDIVIRFPETSRNNIDKIKQIVIANVNGKTLYLNSIADFVLEEGPGEIMHELQKRAFKITANISDNTESLNKTTFFLQKLINKFIETNDIPTAYSIVFKGQAEELKNSRSDIIFALLLAILLVYMILASQYESFIAPVIIILCIPFAYLGVVFVLWLTSTQATIIVLIGLLMLTGIVVNDAIILVDYIIKMVKDSELTLLQIIIRGCKLRMRPILMTTYTTVGGMIPMYMSSGAGAEMRQGIALTVIAGLMTSTLLTLVVLPVVFYKIYSILEWWNNKNEI